MDDEKTLSGDLMGLNDDTGDCPIIPSRVWMFSACERALPLKGPKKNNLESQGSDQNQQFTLW